jgi:hypothetical protein
VEPVVEDVGAVVEVAGAVSLGVGAGVTGFTCGGGVGMADGVGVGGGVTTGGGVAGLVGTTSALVDASALETTTSVDANEPTSPVLTSTDSLPAPAVEPSSPVSTRSMQA